MRLVIALLTIVVVSACGVSTSPSQSEEALLRFDDQARQRQAELNAQAILRGMAQARQRAALLARSAR